MRLEITINKPNQSTIRISQGSTVDLEALVGLGFEDASVTISTSHKLIMNTNFDIATLLSKAFGVNTAASKPSLTSTRIIFDANALALKIASFVGETQNTYFYHYPLIIGLPVHL